MKCREVVNCRECLLASISVVPMGGLVNAGEEHKAQRKPRDGHNH